MRGGRAAPGRCAFSMIEVLMVLAIIGTSAAIVMPRYTSALTNYRLDAAAQRIAADLNAACSRARAASQGRTVTFVFNAGNASYTVSGEAHLDKPGQPYTVDLTKAPYRVLIRSADLGPDNAVVYNGFGTPDRGGNVVVQSGRVTRRVTIDPKTGEAVVEAAVGLSDAEAQ